jgi:hypothetical protein
MAFCANHCSADHGLIKTDGLIFENPVLQGFQKLFFGFYGSHDPADLKTTAL